MGFLFENVLKNNPPNLESQFKITNADALTPSNMIQTYYETKIEELNIRMILKRYLRQTLKEILTEDRDIDKIFLFEIREILKKVQKRFDETDFPEFLELLNELFLICVDKEISAEEQEPSSEMEIEEERPEEIETNTDSIFIRAIQRQAINRLLNYNNLNLDHL